MIQRVQTLYLVAVLALMVTAILNPIATFMAGGDQLQMFVYGVRNGAGELTALPYYLSILYAAAILLPLVLIFMFKRRMVQLRFCFVEMVLLLGAEIVALVYYYLGGNLFDGGELQAQMISWTIFLPLPSIFLCLLAARGIFKDEMMIRSLDRIR